MLKTLTRELTLALQARNGVSVGVVIWLVIMAAAILTAFIFVCVAGYDWLSPRFGGVYAGLIMAGVFLAVAIVSAIIGAMVRRRVRERAILARAARAQTPPWLLDPRVLGVAVEAGRSLGWERIIPVALLGFMVATWARRRRDRGEENP